MSKRSWRKFVSAKRRAGYERWVRDYSSELFGMAYRLCGRHDVADDLVQETYYEAWKTLGRLRDHEKARAWLFEILRHRYARWARSRSRMPSLLSSHESLASAAAAPERSVDEVCAERDTLQLALDSLDERFRVTFLFVFFEGLTCQQAADRLDLPLGTILSRLHRARTQLRHVLTSGLHDGNTRCASENRASEVGKGYPNCDRIAIGDPQPRLRLGGEA